MANILMVLTSSSPLGVSQDDPAEADVERSPSACERQIVVTIILLLLVINVVTM